MYIQVVRGRPGGRLQLSGERSKKDGLARRMPRIHKVTVMQIHVISILAGFCRHLVGKTLINVVHYDIAEIRFVGKLAIIQTFS